MVRPMGKTALLFALALAAGGLAATPASAGPRGGLGIAAPVGGMRPGIAGPASSRPLVVHGRGAGFKPGRIARPYGPHPGAFGVYGAAPWFGGVAGAYPDVRPVVADGPDPAYAPPLAPFFPRIGPPAQGEPGYEARGVIYRIVPDARRPGAWPRTIRYRL